MSHFTVLVRLSAESVKAGLKEALDEALLPYNEQNDDAGYHEFIFEPGFETLETARMAHQTAILSAIDTYEGLLKDLDPKNETKEYAFDKSPAEKVIEYTEIVRKRRADLALLEKGVGDAKLKRMIRDYHGFKFQNGGFGFTRNPNAKWDWYQIGGRWQGKIPLKHNKRGAVAAPPSLHDIMERQGLGGTDSKTIKAITLGEKGDWAKISDIDFNAADKEALEAAAKFRDEYKRFCDGETFGHFDGPRETALRIGLVDCKNADELTGKEWKTIKWDRQLKDGVDRFDVLSPPLVDLDSIKSFFDPLTTFARLDATLAKTEDGSIGEWEEPGEMGWFGCSSDTPESLLAFKDSFRDWLLRGDQNDIVVLVDCHI